ncbi:MAG TPA: hypothetical protein VHE83_03490 [Mycobacteriales bacterium]|nr:hypothetical protein [Mycobacteriales bacterium]
MTATPSERQVSKRAAELTPEERAAGSDNPREQARVVLEESEERVLHPEQTRAESTQTPDETAGAEATD